MKYLNGEKDFMKKQSRKFWNNFHQLMKLHENKVNNSKKVN